MDEKKNILLVGAIGYIASRFLDREETNLKQPILIIYKSLVY